MRTIMFLNAKGGCGKSTLATNLASYYAKLGNSVVLADFDPQGSSLEVAGGTPGDAPAIHGLLAWREVCDTCRAAPITPSWTCPPARAAPNSRRWCGGRSPS